MSRVGWLEPSKEETLSLRNDISDESNFSGSASLTEDRPVVRIEEEVVDGVGSTEVQAEIREVEEACR